MLTEEEFGHLLTVSSRRGNTLSNILRKCWDGPQWLHIEGKISPEKATGAHGSMIGHVTLNELLHCLREVENKNGFSNRVLWVATKRTKLIPIPSWINWRKEYPSIVDGLKQTIANMSSASSREMDWSAEAKIEWNKFYKAIPESDTDNVGSIIARSDAHVLRLIMLYALLDCSCLMLPEHLRAAIAFWRYCERSAQWTFGERQATRWLIGFTGHYSANPVA